jgi:hypothetical protein
MRIRGHSNSWKPHISLKHPNGHRLKPHVADGDTLDLTVVSCTAKGEEYDLDIDVALAVRSISDSHIRLEKFPTYARKSFHQQAATPTSQLEFDVHAIITDDGTQPIESNGENTAVSEDTTNIYRSCDACGEEVLADASYCAACGVEL